MTTTITADSIKDLPLRAMDITDRRLPNFLIRCRPSGAHSYLVRIGRGKYLTLGRVGVMTVAQAREEARNALAQRDMGQTPRQTPKAKVTLRQFLADTYGPWVRTHRKTGSETVTRIQAVFGPLLNHKLADLSTFAIEKWRTERRKAGVAPATINRDINDLRSALTRAVAWKYISTHPLADLKALRVDSHGVVRYLSTDEEARLLKALDARDDTRRAERLTANAARIKFSHEPFPELGTYTDHLTPLVVVALHTGLRRGELFAMRWDDVDLVNRRVTVHGANAKSGRTRHVDLNAIAGKALEQWQTDRLAALSARAVAGPLVFPSATGGTLDNVQTSWERIVKAAKVKGFRFHDLRHTFASKLVMAGVDLNTVRELLGHADLKMTLRYAHLSPDHRRAAVDKLVAV